MTLDAGSEEDAAPAIVTPEGVREASPKRTVGGYDRGSVDRLLAAIAASYQEVWDERDRLREEVEGARRAAAEAAELRERAERLEAELATFDGYDSRIRGILVTADAVADQLRESARREAELAVRKARARALRITRRAERRVARQRLELARLQEARRQAHDEYRLFLLEVLAWLDGGDPDADAVTERPPRTPTGLSGERVRRRTGRLPLPLAAARAGDEAVPHPARRDAR